MTKGLDDVDSGSAFKTALPIIRSSTKFIYGYIYHIQMCVALNVMIERTYDDIMEVVDQFVADNPEEAEKIPDNLYVDGSLRKPMVWSREIFDEAIEDVDFVRAFAWLLAGRPIKFLMIYMFGSTGSAQLGFVNRWIYDRRLKIMNHWYYWTGTEFRTGTWLDIDYNVGSVFRLMARLLIFRFFLPILKGSISLLLLVYKKIFGKKWKTDLKDILDELQGEEDERKIERIMLDVEQDIDNSLTALTELIQSESYKTRSL